MAMDENFRPSYKVCDYIFNLLAMLCLLQLIVLWHFSKATKLFLVTCVQYNYQWVINLVIDFQKILMNAHGNDDAIYGNGVRGTNSNLVGRCRFEWQGTNCDFVNDGEVFIAKGHMVVICDP